MFVFSSGAISALNQLVRGVGVGSEPGIWAQTVRKRSRGKIRRGAAVTYRRDEMGFGSGLVWSGAETKQNQKQGLWRLG